MTILLFNHQNHKQWFKGHFTYTVFIGWLGQGFVLAADVARRPCWDAWQRCAGATAVGGFTLLAASVLGDGTGRGACHVAGAAGSDKCGLVGCP
jgi:hypothetical protein